MKNLQVITTSFILGSLALTSCSTSKVASTSAQDNLYFMASDAQIATEFAVQNNNPESFENLSTVNTETYSQENFSSRNVNPDYIAKYQSEAQVEEDKTVYFDESGDENVQSAGNIDTYNNFRGSGSGNNFMNNPAMSFNMGLGMGMMNPWGMGMMNPWGMGMMNPWGMGGFYDPFFSPWGFRPGFNMNIGFGWGSPFMGMGFGMGGFGMGGFGTGMGFGNPIFILPGGEFGGRNVVVGARPTRGASLAGAGIRNSSSTTIPSTARAQARNEAMNSGGTTNRRINSSTENSRTSSRDFGTSQNDYYNSSRSRVATGTTRNVNSPAVDRGATTRSRSAMPSSRPSTYVGGANSRSTGGVVTNPSRSTNSPNYNRSTSPSYNRTTAPNYNQRSTNPTYNRSTTPSRNISPGYSAPSRSNSSPSYSAPSRSSGGSTGGSSGGTSGGSRSGRGN